MPQKRRLPQRQHSMPRSDDDHDAIMIEARSSGTLHLPGSYSKANPRPKYSIDIQSVHKPSVDYEEKLLGNEDNYVVIVEIANHNDSPSFVQLKLH